MYPEGKSLLRESPASCSAGSQRVWRSTWSSSSPRSSSSPSSSRRMEDTQSTVELRNSQEQPVFTEGQVILNDYSPAKPQEVENMDSGEDNKDQVPPNEDEDIGGEKRHCFEVNYNSGYMYEKESEMIQTRMMDQAINNAITYLGAEALRPLVQTPPAPTSEMVPVISSMYPIALTRTEMPNGGPQDLEKKNTHLSDKCLPSERGLSPNNSGHDSTDTDSNHEERQNHAYQQSHMIPPRARNGMPPLKELPHSYELLKPPPICPRDTIKVINKDGEVMGVFRCDHCRVLFLDYVMFTIHMGCHGFRDPFECNMCGYRSHDRYEFSSHIARGEHRVMLK
ncbi:zinc finger protein Aiolos isoform X7 [Phascolarctos cinereus]